MADIRNRQEMVKAAATLRDTFLHSWNEKGVGALLDELRDLEGAMERPDFWDDPDEAKKISMSKAELERRMGPWRELEGEVSDFPDLVEMTFEEVSEEREAIDSLSADFHALQERFETLQMQEALSGADDGRNAIVTISAGAGGTESQDWAEMLLRMYRRWMDDRGFRTETLDLQPGEEAGIKSATVLTKGENAFGLLRSENGVHRLVRISPFDSNKRRHTSFASVHVMPELDDAVAVDIDEKELRVDTYRASGAGGQHVNKTDSAVRITHEPTGIVVQCQNERSQHKNRAMAMKMLEARLHELEKSKQEEDLENRSGEKRDVSWGSQIRSYVFHPYKMVKDLRTEHETGDVDAVMDGKLDPFINAFLKSQTAGPSAAPTES